MALGCPEGSLKKYILPSNDTLHKAKRGQYIFTNYGNFKTYQAFTDGKFAEGIMKVYQVLSMIVNKEVSVFFLLEGILLIYVWPRC